MQCPFCKEEIIEGAIKCKHCGSVLIEQNNGGGMAGWQAFILAAVLFIGFIMLGGINRLLPLVVVLATSVWASFDAANLEAKNYQSKFMTASPIIVFIGGLLLWIVVFPWYLYFRSNIKAGKISRKNGTCR